MTRNQLKEAEKAAKREAWVKRNTEQRREWQTVMALAAGRKAQQWR